nr:DUF2325 domain-containing protein [uncultured Romboutsia sp.]
MSILVIGGNERMESYYKSIAKSFGYKTKIYTKMCRKMINSIGSPDAIIIFTSTVSHKMAMKAEDEARRQNIPILRSHSSGKLAFENCIKEIKYCMGDCNLCKLNK